MIVFHLNCMNTFLDHYFLSKILATPMMLCTESLWDTDDDYEYTMMMDMVGTDWKTNDDAE